MNRKVVMVLLLLQTMNARAMLSRTVLSGIARARAPQAQGHIQRLARNFSTIKTEKQLEEKSSKQPEEESLGKIALIVLGAGISESLPYVACAFLARVFIQ